MQTRKPIGSPTNTNTYDRNTKTLGRPKAVASQRSYRVDPEWAVPGTRADVTAAATSQAKMPTEDPSPVLGSRPPSLDDVRSKP